MRFVVALGATASAQLVAAQSSSCDATASASMKYLCNQLICTTPWNNTLVAGASGYLNSVLIEYCGTGPPEVNGVCGTCIASTGPGPTENCCVVQDPAACFNKWAQSKDDCALYNGSNPPTTSKSSSAQSTSAMSSMSSSVAAGPSPTVRATSTSKSGALPTACFKNIGQLLPLLGFAVLA